MSEAKRQSTKRHRIRSRKQPAVNRISTFFEREDDEDSWLFNLFYAMFAAPAWLKEHPTRR